MPKLSELDENFKIKPTINKDKLSFYNPHHAPFSVCGISQYDGTYYRMDPEVARRVSFKVMHINRNTSGGRIRFRTNSSSIAILAKYDTMPGESHFSRSGASGFDLYADNIYAHTFVPVENTEYTLEGVVKFNTGTVGAMREIVINMPLYAELNSVLVGLDDGAIIEAPSPYVNKKPIVYYGSSITEGGCASRPGNCYQGMISREFNADFLNLGFSGSALAEDEMIDYIKGLEMSIFVYDYDHNAPSVEHLSATHERAFLRIREKQPTLPIIMMSRPKRKRTESDELRMKIVRQTYENAISRGDKNVYFLDGDDLTSLCGYDGLVDNCHPNDFGFASMARAIIDLMKKEGLDARLI